MNTIFFRILVLSALVLPLQAVSLGVNASAADSCETILDTKCTRCHYLTRVCQMLGKKSKRSWRRTIDNMVRRGTDLTSEERNVLLECLSSASPGDDRICKF